MSAAFIAVPYAGTVTASSGAAAGMPEGNVLIEAPKKIWQSTGATGAYVQIDLGAAKAVTVVAALYTNARSSATWRVYADDTAANIPASAAYDSTSQTLWAGSAGGHARPHALLHLDPAKTYRYWRIEITDMGNPDGAIRVGRVVLSDAWQPTDTVSLGWSYGDADSKKDTEVRGGTIFTRSGARRRVLDASFDWLTEAEMWGDLYDLRQRLSGEDDVLFSLDPAADADRMKRMLYGRLELRRPVVKEVYNKHKQPFRIIELV